jgi:N utilization substance protein B
MQALCQFDVLGHDFAAQLDAFIDDDQHDIPDIAGDLNAGQIRRARAYARDLANGAWAQRGVYHDRLEAAADKWEPGRIGTVERAVLCVAMREAEATGDLSTAVIIDEAVEITRRFAADAAAAFVNGVLETLLKSKPAETDAGADADADVATGDAAGADDSNSAATGLTDETTTDAEEQDRTDGAF